MRIGLASPSALPSGALNENLQEWREKASRARPIAIAAGIGLAIGLIGGLVIAAKLNAPETAVKV